MATLRDTLRDVSGAVRVADFGCVHEGQVGRCDSAVSLEIEQWRGQYRVCIVMRVSKGRSLNRTSVVKWPYSRSSATALQALIADLRLLAQITAPGHLADTRGWFGRLFDRLTASEFLGEYRLKSPLQDADYDGSVNARLYRWREQCEVSLIEGRSGGALIIAHLPQAALTAICDTLEAYTRQPTTQESARGSIP